MCVTEPKTERDKEAAGLPINCRYSRDLGVLQLTVFVVCLAYASEWGAHGAGRGQAAQSTSYRNGRTCHTVLQS